MIQKMCIHEKALPRRLLAAARLHHRAKCETTDEMEIEATTRLAMTINHGIGIGLTRAGTTDTVMESESETQTETETADKEERRANGTARGVPARTTISTTAAKALAVHAGIRAALPVTTTKESLTGHAARAPNTPSTGGRRPRTAARARPLLRRGGNLRICTLLAERNAHRKAGMVAALISWTGA